MHALIWSGAVLALIGVAGILYAALGAIALKRRTPDEAGMRKGMQRALIVNMAAFFVAMIGLMMVVVGVIFG